MFFLVYLHCKLIFGVLTIFFILGATLLHTACERVRWDPFSSPAPHLGHPIKPHPLLAIREAAITLITTSVDRATTVISLIRVQGYLLTSSRGRVKGETRLMGSPTRMKGLPEELSRASYGELHILTMIVTVVWISPLLRATLTFTTLIATTLSSLTSLSIPISQRTELVRPQLRRLTLLPLFTNLPFHPPAPPPLLPLLPGRMGTSKSHCTITHHRERAKLVLVGTVMLKEAAVVMLEAVAM